MPARYDNTSFSSLRRLRRAAFGVFRSQPSRPHWPPNSDPYSRKYQPMNSNPLKKKPRPLTGETLALHYESTEQRKSQLSTDCKSGYENRRNAAACFQTPYGFSGVMVLDEKLPPKCWVNVAVRTIQQGRHRGQKYLSVVLRPYETEKAKLGATGSEA